MSSTLPLSARPCLPKLVSILGLAFLLLGSAVLVARSGEPPRSQSETGLLPLRLLEASWLEGIDPSFLRSLHAKSGGPEADPNRFAEAIAVEIEPHTHGLWEELPDGGQLWRHRIWVPGATDLNFAFGRYRLPPGASLHLLSEEEDYYQGPYTESDNRQHGQLWSPVLPGPAAVLELYVPPRPAFTPELLLIQVGAGFRDLFRRQPDAKQGPCNVDVICSEADDWRDEIRSVAWYSAGGIRRCSGSLVSDVARSGRPFFLTAAHCGINASNEASAVIYWNHESPNCGDLSGGSLADNQSGAIFRARRVDVDMALVELEEVPAASSKVYYNGWDRGEPGNATSVNIHHPGFDEKSFNFNQDPLGQRNSCIIVGATGLTHWLVHNWEMGTTEGGSSGSPLFNGDNKAVIGFLSGGTSSCSRLNGFDCYGRFDLAWDGASPTERLRDWLDPDNTNTLRVTGYDPNQATGSCPLPIGHSRYCNECGPCGEGQGDCDADTDCQGGLVCGNNIGAQFGFAPKVDVCVPGSAPGPCNLAAGSGRFCTDCGPCGEGQGDCDSDAECATGLTCANNVGESFGFGPKVDVCTAGDQPICTLPPGHGRFCTECGPCSSGQGDCDSDAECRPGLTCQRNVGAQFGFSEGVDVCG